MFALVRGAEAAARDRSLSAEQARALILAGRAPAGMRVGAHLNLADSLQVRELPPDIAVDSLDLSGCLHLEQLPEGLRARRLNVSNCRSLTSLPGDLRCYDLEARSLPLRSLPAGLRVEYRLDLEGCAALETLPPGLKVGTLSLRGCSALRALPEGMDVCFLDLSGCASLEEWPRRASVRYGRLTLSDCAHICALPLWLSRVAQLDLSGCAGLASLPDGLEVTSWLDLADTAIRSLPTSLRGVQLRWRGVPIDARVAFRPESITATEVLAQPNAELRRVLLERLGYETFFAQARAQVLDRDTDPGGERRLLRVPLPGDEDLVCLSVRCPSTGRRYLLRVPPNTTTCRRAAAWIAGFDNPNDWNPLVET